MIDNIFSLHNGKISRSSSTDYTLVSHGHFDHLPTRLKERKIVCSPETAKIIKFRKKNKTIDFSLHPNVSLLNAGHCIGSKMFYFKDNSVLYTGDFNTVPKYCGVARPCKCSKLIIETTFGKPKYVFPKYSENVRELRDYVLDHNKVIIDAYTFGKSQEICFLLDKFKIPFNVSGNISEVNDILGLKYRYLDNRADALVGKHFSDSHKRMMVSGWAIDKPHLWMKGIDYAIPLSDHADFNSLYSFVKKCNPSKIYTFHGFNVEFAYFLKQKGFDAEPILMNQRLLTEF